MCYQFRLPQGQCKRAADQANADNNELVNCDIRHCPTVTAIGTRRFSEKPSRVIRKLDN
jgi:hypothetical protein